MTWAFVLRSGVSRRVAEGKDFCFTFPLHFRSDAGSSTKMRRSKGIVTSFVDSDVIDNVLRDKDMQTGENVIGLPLGY